MHPGFTPIAQVRTGEAARIKSVLAHIYFHSLLFAFTRLVKLFEISTQVSETLNQESEEGDVKQFQAQLRPQGKVALVKNDSAAKSLEKARGNAAGRSARFAEELNSGKFARLIAVIKPAVTGCRRGVDNKNVDARGVHFAGKGHAEFGEKRFGATVHDRRGARDHSRRRRREANASFDAGIEHFVQKVMGDTHARHCVCFGIFDLSLHGAVSKEASDDIAGIVDDNLQENVEDARKHEAAVAGPKRARVAVTWGTMSFV